MSSGPRDTYDQFSDASTTPFWDIAILLTSLAAIAGGGLALVYGIGYLSVGRTSLAWPMLATAAVLISANLALRHGRRTALRRG
jgi:membrane protein implicated in regulation of membrane protease activity